MGTGCEPHLIVETELYGELILFLDTVRSPQFRSDVFFEDYVLPLEFGVLTATSFIEKAEIIDWENVVDCVSS